MANSEGCREPLFQAIGPSREKDMLTIFRNLYRYGHRIGAILLLMVFLVTFASIDMFAVKAAMALTLLAVGISGRPEPPVSQQYLPPDQQYGPPQRNGGVGVGNPSFGGFAGAASGASGYGRPGQSGPSAGAPGAPFGSNQYLPPNQQYGVPGAGGNAGYDDGYNNGPAKYNFEYMVNDIESGNDFGHKESRDGDVTRGVYYVLLPDGRRQTVEYEADQNGFRPKITYVQEGTGIGGGSGQNGYPSGNNGYRY